MGSIELLEELVGFPTVSAAPNFALIDFVRDYLTGLGATVEVMPNAERSKANLFATLGPTDRAGVLLAGHSDVVPAEGQNWSGDPFALRRKDDRLYGRGTADMKGFLASVLNAAELASKTPLATPLHIAFSYDEEIGCVGVRPMLERLARRDFHPRACIIGEPTSMKLALGHKGKMAARATCCGVAAHSALAPTGLNAIHLACDFIAALRTRQNDIAAHGHRDEAYDVPYSTIHVGTIRGGTVLNIVPTRATLDFEIRTLAQDDEAAILSAIEADAERLAAAHRAAHPEAAIDIEKLNAYPGLDVAADAEIVAFMRTILDEPELTRIAFGTEGGLYTRELGIPVIVCGPGSMDQGHKADEFVTTRQIELCDDMLARLVGRLAED